MFITPNTELNARVAAEEAFTEYLTARQKFPPLNSGHEGYAVILEELDELWAEVQANKGDPQQRMARMKKEAMQVAAMAIAFMVECCE